MKANDPRQRWLHHGGVALGLTGLGFWFWAGRACGFLDWATALAPSNYSGAALMLAIMVMMLPALLIWKHYNRWLERKLNITGRYLEDEVYLPPDKK